MFHYHEHLKRKSASLTHSVKVKGEAHKSNSKSKKHVLKYILSGLMNSSDRLMHELRFRWQTTLQTTPAFKLALLNFQQPPRTCHFSVNFIPHA